MKKNHALLFFAAQTLKSPANDVLLAALSAASATLPKPLARLAAEAAEAHRAAHSLTADLIARIDDELSGQKRLRLGK